MMNRHLVEISSVGDSPTTASLTVDGHDISRITRGLSLDLSAWDPHQLTVRLAGFPVQSLLNDVHVKVDQETHDFLVRLGWTPPTKD
jgi:hypothetical protein